MTFAHALVTGGAGFIGSHLTRKLLAAGRKVTVIDNLSVGRRDAVPDGARFVHGDIRDGKSIGDALDGVDCVFHLAAQVTIRGSSNVSTRISTPTSWARRGSYTRWIHRA